MISCIGCFREVAIKLAHFGQTTFHNIYILTLNEKIKINAKWDYVIINELTKFRLRRSHLDISLTCMLKKY